MHDVIRKPGAATWLPVSALSIWHHYEKTLIKLLPSVG
jgi:hypothetical protein